MDLTKYPDPRMTSRGKATPDVKTFLNSNLTITTYIHQKKPYFSHSPS